MKEFWNLVQDYASDDLKRLLESPPREGITVFVPSNEVLILQLED
jgi:hypothetical protein